MVKGLHVSSHVSCALGIAFTALLCLFSPSDLGAATKKAIQRLQTELLDKYRGSPPSAVIQVLGAPTSTTIEGGDEFLTWESSRQSGAFVYGVGATESYTCRATFRYRADRLFDVSLLGATGSDRTMCKKFIKPLLSTSPGAVSGASKEPHASSVRQSSQPTKSRPLTNDDIIRMSKANLPESVILTKVRTSPRKFDTSIDALIALKEAGVSDAVIQAMTEKDAEVDTSPSE